MATKIVTKNSSTASAVPTASDLVQGELAVNVADKRLFTEDNGGAIVELGTNPSTLTVTGEITANGGIALGDNDKATFGSGDDLQIYHDGSNSYIDDAGTGNLRIRGSQVILEKYTGETILQGIADGSVYIFHDNAEKLATTSTGINVTGGGDAIFLLNTASDAGDKSLIRFGDNNDADAGYIDYDHGTNSLAFGVNVAERMRIDSSGNVGIGLTAPDAPLSVYSPSASANIKLTRAGTSENLQLGTYYINSTNNDLQLATTTSHPMVFKTNNSERMRIDSTGRVGIGRTPSISNSKLEVGGADNVSLINVEASGVTGGMGIGSTGLQFFHGSTARMRIDSNGNVGIGTSSPDAPLSFGAYIPSDGQTIHTYQSGNVRSGLGIVTGAHRMFTNSSSVLSFGQVSESDGSTYTERMRIDSSGNLLINCTSLPAGGIDAMAYQNTGDTALLLSSTGTGGSYQIRFFNANGEVGNIVSDGSATDYNTSSDQRLKENIADADDAGSKVDAIQVRKFDWKADGSHQDYGMIAQELQTVAPEAVSGDADSEDMMGVDYSKLVPMLIKEIQSLRNRVAQLEE